MESNQASAALALQIQTLTASMEELTRQNQEMRLGLQQKENRSRINQENEGDNQRRNDRRRPTTLDGPSSDLLREMKKEMDELRNTIKRKIDRSLDRMVKTMDPPFTAVVLECLVPSKFRLPQFEPFDGLKDPLDHLNTFKTTLGLQQPPTKYCAALSPPFLKELQGNGSRSYQHHPSTVSSSWAVLFYVTSSEDSAWGGQQTTYSPSGKERRRPWGRTWSVSLGKL